MIRGGRAMLGRYDRGTARVRRVSIVAVERKGRVMACTGMLKPNQTLAQRMQEVDAALARLKRYLTTGSVKLVIAPNGAVAFSGWKDRDDLSDACTYRALMAQGSWELRQAVARAEAMQGRKVNPMAVAAGHHSHDGGNTWHGGH